MRSKGLTHTLITEAITSGKSLDDIKDLLHLKICNSDIHTSISCFMEIQQKEKESLTAYIHHYKREAKRCNFTNNATTIRIFVKGIKNAHSLAAHILWEVTTNSDRCHLCSWEAPCHTAAYGHIDTILHSECHISWRGSLFSMPGIRPHSTSLSKCMLFWVQWIWIHSCGLSTQNTTFRYTYTLWCRVFQEVRSHFSIRSTLVLHLAFRFKLLMKINELALDIAYLIPLLVY